MKVRTNILIDEQTLKTAQDAGLNISKSCENALNLYIEAILGANGKIKNGFLGAASFGKEGALEPRAGF